MLGWCQGETRIQYVLGGMVIGMAALWLSASPETKLIEFHNAIGT